jgi:hypothetical protein
MPTRSLIEAILGLREPAMLGSPLLCESLVAARAHSRQWEP